MDRLTFSPRAVGLGSLALLATYAALAIAEAPPWPLGGEGGHGALGVVSLVLGLGLGWAVPGLVLVGLVGAPASATALLGRAFGLGVGYVVAVGLLHASLVGHAPARGTLLALLAAPALVALARPGGARVPAAAPALALVAMAVVAAALWPKLAREGLNGDGTEAYELARSLEAHALPYWDLERAEPPGRFGTPVVNPFVTSSFLTAAQMRLLGTGELAARLPLVPAFVIGAALAAGLARRAGASGALYAAGVALTWLLWNAWWVGYEPAFTDLAEPAATDMVTTVLFLAGVAEAVGSSRVLAVGAFLLAAGVLYSGPVLAALFVLALWRLQPELGRPLFALGWRSLAVAVALGLAYGAGSGQLGDWTARVWAEYWLDLTDAGRRVANRDVLLPLLLATGGMPLLAALRWSRLSPASKGLLLTAAGYLGLVLVHSYKNLHYLAPLPFLLIAPALDAAPERWRLAALLLVIGGGVLAWPQPRELHRETQELGRITCIDGLSYEEACLAADVVYDAFAPPGLHASRFAVGKHTFVRYGLDLGGRDCAFRLARDAPDGFWRVAGDGVALFVRDTDVYARWRLRVPTLASSRLFPRGQPDVLPERPGQWPIRVDLGAAPGEALWVERFAADRRVARLLVPADGRGAARLGLEHGSLVSALVDGALARLQPAGDAIAVDSERWGAGFHLLELRAAAGPVPVLSWLERPRSDE